MSCFGILLFLWITFGGPTPFKAKPYELKIPFDSATQLAEQSDVRISGVDVGKVQEIALAPNRKQALATIYIEDRYAPLPLSTRAILRTKTLLGETYVELTPGNRNGPKLPDGATLPSANVEKSVQLDEIFRTFNPKTRAAFQDLDAGSRRRDRRSGRVPLCRAGRVRPDLHRIRPALPRPRYPAPRGPPAVQQRRGRASRCCAADRASWPA